MPQGFNSSGNSSYSRRKKRVNEVPKPKKEEPGLMARMLKGVMDRVDHDSMLHANTKAERDEKAAKKRRK